MKPELKAKILAYNKAMAEKKDKAQDLDEILEHLWKVYELVKPFLSDKVKTVFEKYGYGE